MSSLRGTPLPRCELVIAIEDNSSLYLTYYCAIYMDKPCSIVYNVNVVAGLDLLAQKYTIIQRRPYNNVKK